MISNTERRAFDVVEITNEMPLNRTGGVGTVIDNLMSGFAGEGIRALWFLTDHGYNAAQMDDVLARFADVAIGSVEELGCFTAPLTHVHSYQQNPALEDHLSTRLALVTIHSLLALEERTNDVQLGAAVHWQERLIACSACVVLLSRAERRQYTALGYDRLNPCVRVVHNGVRAPARFRTPRGKQVLGYCGRLVPRKHPEYVQWLLNEPGYEDCRVLVAGRGFSQYARTLLYAFGLDERVQFLGWCAGERLDAFFDAIDVLAVPSTYEPFGLVAVEAAARGIPVVCTAVDGLVEVLGPHAFYCADTSFDAFKDAMNAWRAAPAEELAARCRGAQLRYQRRYTDRMMGRRYGRLFREFAARR